VFRVLDFGHRAREGLAPEIVSGVGGAPVDEHANQLVIRIRVGLACLLKSKLELEAFHCAGYSNSNKPSPSIAQPPASIWSSMEGMRVGTRNRVGPRTHIGIFFGRGFSVLGWTSTPTSWYSESGSASRACDPRLTSQGSCTSRLPNPLCLGALWPSNRCWAPSGSRIEAGA